MAKSKQKSPQDLANEATKLLQEERQARVEQCRLEIEGVLKKHGCKIQGGCTIRSNKVFNFAEIVAQ